MKYLLLFFSFFFLHMTLTSAQTNRMENRNVGLQHANVQSNMRNTRHLMYVQEARRLYQQFDVEEAILSLDNAISASPDEIEPLLLRAQYKRVIGMNKEADIDMQIARRLNPYATDLYSLNNSQSVMNLIAVYPKNAMQSLNTFQKLNYYFQEIDERASKSFVNEGEVKLLENAVLLIDAADYSEAMDTLNQLIAEFPNSAIAHDLKGVLLFKQGEYEAAVRSFTTAVKLHPEFAIAWYNYGLAEKAMGNLDLAKKYLDMAIELQDDMAKAYFERAVVSKEIGNEEDAVKDYDKVIDLKGDTYLAAYTNRGLTKKMLGDFTGALNDFNKVIRNDADNPEIYKNRGNLHFIYGSYFEAVKDYTQAIVLDDQYAEAYFNRGMAHILQYQKVIGCKDLQQSAALGYERANEKIAHFCME